MYSLINFNVMGDERGSLIAIENDRQIPFSIQRVFYMYGSTNDVVRGCHANRKSQFVLIAINGHCKVRIKDHQDMTVEISLDTPAKGLWLDKMVWKEMFDFSQNAILLVLSNEKYDKAEYVYDHNQYLNEVRK